MLAAGTLFAGRSSLSELIIDEKGYQLTVLHTNDVHSRIEPFPMDGSSNQGLGGVTARAEIIEKIRREEEYVLLLDAGDICLLYTSPSPRDGLLSRMPSSA